MENFVAEMESQAPEHKKLAEALVKKIQSYSHWPDSKKLGLKLLPFTESKAMVFLLADILKSNRQYPEFLHVSYVGTPPDLESYGAFVHIFILYVVHQKEGYEEIVSVLGHLLDKAIATVMRDESDNKYYMLKCIFNIYKAEKEPLLRELVKKLDAVPSDKLRFEPINEGTAYEVHAYSEYTCGDVKIPSSYKGKPVKEIAYNGFMRCKGLTSIEIPEGIEVIGKHAFHGCGNLKNILFPASLSVIGSYAFSYCYKLKDVMIPKNVVEMGEYIFPYVEVEKMSSIKVLGYTEKPEGWDENWHRESNFGETFHKVIWNYQA